MAKFHYAGIGSRETPESICERMTEIAEILEERGFVLRSGGAIGADKAFENGAKAKEIFRAEDANAASFILAEQYHPRWDRCSSHAQKLLARNGMQVLGRNLDDPSGFIVCWTKDGKASGGTGQAIRIANAKRIPVFNLKMYDAEKELFEFLESY